MVVFVAEIDSPRAVYRDTGRETDLRGERWPAVAPEAVHSVSGNRVDEARRCINPSDPVVERVRYVDITSGVQCEDRHTRKHQEYPTMSHRRIILHSDPTFTS